MHFNRALAVTVVFLTTLVNAGTAAGRIQVKTSTGSPIGFLQNLETGL
jgi:hypothetical protein